MKKRILPVLLALCMVMSLLPVAFAAAGANGCTCDGSEANCKQYSSAQHGDGQCTGTATDDQCSDCKKDTTPPSGGDNDVTCTCTSDACTNDSHADKSQACGATVEDTSAGNTLCNACKPADEGPGGDGGDGDDGEDTPAECTGGTDCAAPAGTHKSTGFADAEGGTTAACKKYVKCGVGGCDLDKGHEADHSVGGGNIAKCLGYSADAKCSAATHIAGCPKYDCGCDHTDAGFNDSQEEGFVALTCTSKPGCPLCASWNSYVSGKNAEYNKALATYQAAKAKWDADKAAYDAAQAEDPTQTAVKDPGAEPTAPTNPNLTACECADCRPNPAMGVVTDENGNPVDPTDPTDPEVPSKAEDFTDMEDWMAADVQVALDKGWLEGYGDGTFNGRGVTSGATIAAVLARMDGETITGGTWAMDALKWAADQDAFEGIELTGDSMARKDLVLVIWRMAGKPAAEKELEFTDVDGLEGDHLTAMQWAVENGIVKGNGDGTVTPDGSVNRAALCAMLARYDALEK